MEDYKIEERNLVSAKFNDNHLYGLNEVVSSLRCICTTYEISIER